MKTNLISARITNPWLPTSLQNLSGAEFFSRLLSVFLTLGLIVGAIAFFFMLLTGALAIITSEGDKARVEQARQKLTTAVIGLIILFAIFAIINLVESVFVVDILQITLPTL